MGKTKPCTKRRRKHGKPVELSLEELGLLTHIRAHLTNGTFQHPNAATGEFFGRDKSTISRLVTSLEAKDKVTVKRSHDSKGYKLPDLVAPKSQGAQVHQGKPLDSKGFASKSGALEQKPRCTGEHNTVALLPVDQLSVDQLSVDSYKNTVVYDAPVHLGFSDLAAARAKLARLREKAHQNFGQEMMKSDAKEIRKAQAEVYRLQDLRIEMERAQ